MFTHRTWRTFCAVKKSKRTAGSGLKDSVLPGVSESVGLEHMINNWNSRFFFFFFFRKKNAKEIGN